MPKFDFAHPTFKRGFLEFPEKRICCICHYSYTGDGNSAYPIASGRCCDKCNNKVIKARISNLRGK